MGNVVPEPITSESPTHLIQALDRLAEPRLAVPFLTLLGLLIFVVNLGGYPIYTKGEPREAIRILDLYHGANFILPSQAGIGLPWKPPLMYWLGALISMVAGRVNEWTVRLPSALLAIGGILICYGYLTQFFNRRIAVMAAIILGSSFQYVQAGTAARVDMTLTFFMELAFFEFLMIAEGLTRRRMLLYAAIAAAILAKGPVGALLPGLVALIWMLLERRTSLIRGMRLVRGGLLVLVSAGGWYLAASIIGGMAFVHRQILEENFSRMIPTAAIHEPHAHPFYFMEGALFAGFLPWSIFLALGLVQFGMQPQAPGPRGKYLIVWFATVLLFYSFPISKRGVYLLALYPPLAALTAILLNRMFYASARTAALMRSVAWASGLLSLLVAAIALMIEAPKAAGGLLVLNWLLHKLSVDGSHFIPQLLYVEQAHRAAAVLLPVLLAAAGVYLLRSTATPDRVFVGAATAWCAIVVASHVIFVPAIAKTLTLKQFIVDSMAIVRNGTVASVGGVNFDMSFYAPRDIPDVVPSRAVTYEYLFCSRREYDLLPSSVRGRFVGVLTSGPTDLDGAGQVLLLRRVELATTRVTPGASARTTRSVVFNGFEPALLHLGRDLERAGGQLESA